MIPSLGATEFGPLVSLILTAFAAIVVGLVVIPWTVARNRSHLRVRGRITVVLMAVGVILAAIAAFARYEQRSAACPGALPAYGLGLRDLATMESADRCAVAGQLLVVFAESVVAVEVLGSVFWAVSRDPVLDDSDDTARAL